MAVNDRRYDNDKFLSQLECPQNENFSVARRVSQERKIRDKVCPQREENRGDKLSPLQIN